MRSQTKSYCGAVLYRPWAEQGGPSLRRRPPKTRKSGVGALAPRRRRDRRGDPPRPRPRGHDEGR